MALTHGNVIFDILEHSALQKYCTCWVFRAFFRSTFFYMYFAIQPRPALSVVIYMYAIISKSMGFKYGVSSQIFHQQISTKFSTRIFQPICFDHFRTVYLVYHSFEITDGGRVTCPGLALVYERCCNVMEHYLGKLPEKNTIRDGGTYTAYTVYTVYTVNTVQTTFHCLKSSMYGYAYVYC